MDECLHILENSNECPTDKAFAKQVRLQLFSQKVTHLGFQRDDAQDSEIRTEGRAAPPPPPSFYLTAVESQLNELKGSITSDVLQDSESRISSPMQPRS
jgi:hypothetical protein